MNSVLLAESGSTKTDWCLLQPGDQPVHFKTSGINPFLQSPDAMVQMLQQELRIEDHAPGAIYFYGAGCARTDRQQEVAGALRHIFQTGHIEVQGDMMAAARALCADKPGIVCILGTGSNSCYYDGSRIAAQQASLGYIAGDEGSGNHMGKRVLQYYAYHTFDDELRMGFEQLFGNDLGLIVQRLYREPFPNRYLAQFVQLLKLYRGHFMVENIIEDCLNEFFNAHILKYRESWQLPLYFSGSVAYEFRDVIADMCLQSELELGHIEQSPMAGLIAYHQQRM